MPETTNPKVEMTCLQGLADLERLEGPLVNCFGTSDPEMTAAAVRLLLTHLNWNSKQLLGAMVLDRLDADLLSRDVTGPGTCHVFVTPPLSNKKADP